MIDVGTTHEDLENFLAEHHLVGAGLRRDGRAAPRQGNTAAHWKWDGIYRGLMRSGEIVTVGPNGMTGMRSVVGIEARRFSCPASAPKRTATCAAKRALSAKRPRMPYSYANTRPIRWSAAT